jgi:hypothetical protein
MVVYIVLWLHYVGGFLTRQENPSLIEREIIRRLQRFTAPRVYHFVLPTQLNKNEN